MERVYLDNASTTPLDPLVLQEMLPFMQSHHGNPSSIHYHGRKVRAAIEEARTKVARLLNASTGEIFFTSSATEANNMVLFGSVRDLGITHIISSPTEHDCILNTLEQIEASGLAKVNYLDVDSQGNIDPAELESALIKTNGKTLVTFMHANNEIGTLSRIDELSHISREYGAFYHSDTVQSVGKFPLDLQELSVNYCCGSAHKFYGPKGIGFLYMDQDNPFKSTTLGGGQERNMRAGTENVYGIIGLARALELAIEKMEERTEQILKLRRQMISGLHSIFDDLKFNGNQHENFHYGILNFSIPRNEISEMIMMNLDISGISASAGSACNSGVEHESHVLQAIGAPQNRKAIRFSFSHLNTAQEIDHVISEMQKIHQVSTAAT